LVAVQRMVLDEALAYLGKALVERQVVDILLRVELTAEGAVTVQMALV